MNNYQHKAGSRAPLSGMLQRLLSRSSIRLSGGAAFFLGKAVLLVVLWKVVYIGWLLPQEIPDAWLIRKTAEATCRVLNTVTPRPGYYPVHQQALRKYGGATVNESFTFIQDHGHRPVLGIFNACTALELMILYTGFLICFPAKGISKLVFSVTGVAGIFGVNVLRSCLLVWVKLSLPGYFNFAHKYFFNLVVYAWIFLLWVVFVNHALRNAKSHKAPAYEP